MSILAQTGMKEWILWFRHVPLSDTKTHAMGTPGNTMFFPQKYVFISVKV